MLADVIRIASDRQLQMAFSADDVVLRAAVDRTDRHHRRLGGLDLAADDRLQVEDQSGGLDDRINCGMGSGAMTAAAVQFDIDAVDVRQGVAGPIANPAGGQRASTCIAMA